MDDHNSALVERVRCWGEQHDDIRAINLFGSAAYPDTSMYDQYSDVDLAVYAIDPTPYFASQCWLGEFGDVRIVTQVPFFGHDDIQVFELYFADHLMADISVFPVNRIVTLVELPYARAVIARGYKVLVDKDGILPEMYGSVDEQPTQGRPLFNRQDLRVKSGRLAFAVLHIAKRVARGDVCNAVLEMAGNVHPVLGELVLDYTTRRYGAVHVPAAGLRNLRHWADPLVTEGVAATFALPDRSSLWPSLGSCLDLAVKLVREISMDASFEPETEELEFAIRELAWLGAGEH